MSEQYAAERRVKPSPNLTDQVTAMLSEEITGGQYERGDALPSEHALARAFGVSRSVIRESVSRLKADGLVISRQGRGAFVASTIGQASFHISGDSANELSGAQKILELRMGMETEAAGLAAANRQAKDLRDMRKALNVLKKAVETGSLEKGVNADLRFHRAICLATANPHYVAFFDFLSPFLRKEIRITRRHSKEQLGRSADAENEHNATFRAIEAGDADAARKAARRHVANTMVRLRLTGADDRPLLGQGAPAPCRTVPR